MDACVRICMYALVFNYMSMCMHVCMYQLHEHVYAYVGMYVCMHVCMYVCMAHVRCSLLPQSSSLINTYLFQI